MLTARPRPSQHPLAQRKNSPKADIVNHRPQRTRPAKPPDQHANNTSLPQQTSRTDRQTDRTNKQPIPQDDYCSPVHGRGLRDRPRPPPRPDHHPWETRRYKLQQELSFRSQVDKKKSAGPSTRTHEIRTREVGCGRFGNPLCGI